MNAKRTIPFIILYPCFIILGSCIGVKADISVNPDNSGTIVLEYKISRVLEALGKQDGNERWLPVPVGKADFERSVQRLPGIRLLSFSSKTDERDMTNTAKLEFSNMASLANFLDPSGGKVVYQKSDSGGNSLFIQLDKMRPDNSGAAFMDLVRSISEPYSVSINMSLPHEGKLDAPPLSGAVIVPSGRKPGISLPLNVLANSEEPVGLNFRW